MSQDKKPKEKIEVKPHNAIVIDLPMVRNFSTGGGHGPEDTLTEGDEKIVTLVELAGAREVHGLNALADGKVDDARREAAVKKAAQAGFQGA